MWRLFIFLTTSAIFASQEDSREQSFVEGVKCTPNDPIECTGRNPVCVFSKSTGDYRCCSDVPQDLSNPPGVPEQVKPICPYGASSYDIPSVLLCDPTEANPCPEEYSCEQAVNHQMLVTYNMHLCCKTSTLDSFENGRSTRIRPNKQYLSAGDPHWRPLFHASTSLQETGLPPQDPHGNPEAMHFYYNRPSTLSREIDLAVPAWDEGVFFRNMNRVLTIQSDQTSTKQVRKLYIVLVFQTKVRLTRRNAQTWHDFHANYTSFTDFLSSETGKFLGTPVAGSYFYITN
ncbi:hypothetical protein ANCCEY_00063 [Ancylostoma ceylanicum]|uniref:Tectonic domain-containing protein n=1 Tax=Ancylostoma ceylanicum TaxID=53326 RepID=A0A0D6MC32_9BILA|nr:hypothetical protein ANCCEY_00063 [Ancylostoma ceylanicum]